LPDLVREGSDTDEARNGGVSLRAQQGRGAVQNRNGEERRRLSDVEKKTH
jgi:hypothetical protein